MVAVDAERTVLADFTAWYSTTANGVTRRVSAALGDPLLGREAVAEAYARAYQRWPRVSVMGSPEGWVYRVAVNLGRSIWRRRELETRALARTLSETLLRSDATAEDYRDDVHRAVRRLTTRQRTAVRLRYWEDLTEKEVAARMGVAPGTVAALLNAARERLRPLLGQNTAGGGR